MASSVTLGGVPLDMQDGATHSWSLTSGVQAHQQAFIIHKDLAAEIVKRGQKQLTEFVGTRVRNKSIPVGPLSFVVNHSDGEKVTIHGLYVINQLPASDPNFVSVVVADFRWLWTRIHIERSYNLRRKTCQRRLLGDGTPTPVQIAPNSPDYGFRRASVQADGTPYTARDVLEDVLTELVGPKNFTIDVTPNLDPIETFELRDPGPAAMLRVLAKLPGIEIAPTLAGKIRAFNSLDQSEVKTAERVEGSRIFGGGEWRVVDFSFLRPPQVDVLFERDVEVRFDYKTEGAQPATAKRTTKGKEEPTLQNVMPVPDIFIPINGKPIVRGTWVTVESYLAALEELGDFPKQALRALTDEDIRKAYLPGWSLLLMRFVKVAGSGALGGSDAVWARRIAALQQHWRRTFRIHPTWIDKIKAWKPIRTAVIDEETGTRARSEAFFDYIVKPSVRAVSEFGNAFLGYRVDAFAEDLADAQPSPVDFTVVDQDEGVFTLAARVDPFGIGAAIAPGTIDTFPESNAANELANWMGARGEGIPLDAAWSIATVLTVVPEQPNDDGRLYRQTVTPTQAHELLPKGSALGPTKGMPWEVFSSLTQARSFWVDGDGGVQIKQSIWEGTPMPNRLLANPDELLAVAKAQAARIYATLIDRGMGRMTVSIDPTVVPTGNLKTVTHGLRRSGGAYLALTVLEMPQPSVAPSVASLMPEAWRNRIYRLVQL